MSIYGAYEATLEQITEEMISRLYRLKERPEEEGGRLFTYVTSRIKTDESVCEKCSRRGLPFTTLSALTGIYDSIGIRVICRFLDDVYLVVDEIKKFDRCRLVEEKDYIRDAKPNGYRSYHLIVEIEVPYPDVRGERPGHYYVEFQVRTIAMDTWANLEHEIKYKRDVQNQKIITAELKKCADQLASCDLSLQTLRRLIASKE